MACPCPLTARRRGTRACATVSGCSQTMLNTCLFSRVAPLPRGKGKGEKRGFRGGERELRIKRGEERKEEVGDEVCSWDEERDRFALISADDTFGLRVEGWTNTRTANFWKSK